MTTDEAIRIIKIVLTVAEDFEITVQGEEFTKEKCKEALDMAIEALKKINKINKIAHIRSIEDLNGLNCEEAILGLFKTVLEENTMRNATPEEQKLADDYIKSISKTTGVDFGTLPQESCDDCVSREYILSKAHGGDWNGGGFSKEYVYIEDIENAPPVKPTEKVGQWIEQIDHEENCRTLICSNCDRPALHDGDSIWKHKFCPHCGAKMREDNNGKNNSN